MTVDNDQVNVTGFAREWSDAELIDLCDRYFPGAASALARAVGSPLAFAAARTLSASLPALAELSVAGGSSAGQAKWLLGVPDFRARQLGGDEPSAWSARAEAYIRRHASEFEHLFGSLSALGPIQRRPASLAS